MANKIDFEETLKKLKLAYKDKLSSAIECLDSYISKNGDIGDPEREVLEKTVHGLAGSGTTVGFPEITEHARPLDIALHEKYIISKDLIDKFKILLTICQNAQKQVLDNSAGLTDALMPITALNAKVLLVEDDLVNQMVSTDMLELIGCRVDLAENGVEALARLEENNIYDMIFMDCMMPVMDGFETTRIIRENEKNLLLPPQIIIAMTGNTRDKEKDKCISVGMDDYLCKPVKKEDLHQKISLYLKQRP